MANLVGLWTKFKRESRRFIVVWPQTVLSPIFTNLLYMAIFGISLHKSMPNIGDVSYLEFLAPGLIIMGMINNSFQNPSSSIIIAKAQGHIGELLTIPLSKFEIIMAYLSAAILRAFIIGVVTFLTLIFFVKFHFDSIFIIFLSGFLISMFFSFLGFFIGIWAKDFDDVALVGNFLLTPMTFLGGVFYRISSMPEIFQQISKFNPLAYMIDVFRYGFTGIHEYNIYLSLTMIIISNILLGSISYLLLKKGWKIQT